VQHREKDLGQKRPSENRPTGEPIVEQQHTIEAGPSSNASQIIIVTAGPPARPYRSPRIQIGPGSDTIGSESPGDLRALKSSVVELRCDRQTEDEIMMDDSA
jgi:hypothetical protein